MKVGKIIPLSTNNSKPVLQTPSIEIKFNVVDIPEGQLPRALEDQAKQGFEFITILTRKDPGPYSADTIYKVLLRSK